MTRFMKYVILICAIVCTMLNIFSRIVKEYYPIEYTLSAVWDHYTIVRHILKYC